MQANSNQDFEQIDPTDQIDDELAHHYIPHPGFTQSQKIAAALLAFFSVIIVVFWFFQFKTDLTGKENEAATNNQTDTQDEMCEGGNCDKNYDLKLRGQDTDGDHLSDWDELNVYLTSPYLEDSDSDGYTDSDEISRGEDPNCPAGRDCAITEDNLDDYTDLNTENLLLEEQKKAGESEEKTDDSVLGGLPAEVNPDDLSPDDLVNIYSENPGELRKILEEAGLEKELLDQFSDAELIETYKEILLNNEADAGQ